MAIYRHPPEVHEFVKKWAPKLRDRELAQKCNEELGTNFTERSMKSFRGNHGYRNGKKQWTSEEYWKYQTHYPPGFIEFVRENSWGVSSKDMAEMVNEKFGLHFTPGGMKTFRGKHGIKSGLTGWYRKGRPPGNKGKKLEEYVNDPERIKEIRRRILPTTFKKGHRPANEVPVGTITVNADGYKQIKVSMKGDQWERWKMLHRYVWEQHNGPIPEDMMVSFKDGDHLNCDISNLMLITKAENSMLTHGKLRSNDPEMTEIGLSIVRLKNKTRNLRRDRDEKSD